MSFRSFEETGGFGRNPCGHKQGLQTVHKQYWRSGLNLVAGVETVAPPAAHPCCLKNGLEGETLSTGFKDYKGPN